MRRPLETMERLAEDLTTMVRTPLAASHVERLRAAGTEVTFAPGENITTFGEPNDAFFYVEEGEAAGFDELTGARYGSATLGPTQFVGEISFLNGGTAMLTTRALKPTRAIRVERARMLELMAQIPEMGDIVVTVFAARRRKLLESNSAGLTLLGLEQDRGLRSIAAFAARNRIPYRTLELHDPEASILGERCGLRPGHPAVIFGERTVIEEPSPRAIAQRFGLDLCIGEDHVVDVVVVGGGPAGIAAGVYAGAEGISALVLEDLTIGGQAGTSSRIENYVGFPTGISGADLCYRGEIQALKFGTRFAVPRRATRLSRRDDGLFCVGLEDGAEVCARAVVVATGVQYRRLPLERLEAFEGAGIYYAATEVEARYCRNTEVVVIGGGNSAGQAAMFLSRTARHVHVLVRGPTLASSMSDYLLSRLQQDPTVSIHYRSEMVALHGDTSLSGITLKTTDGGVRTIDTQAVFVMVGAAPNTDWLSGMVELDEKGFVRTGAAASASSSFATSEPGVFAVGDVRAGSVKRVASAVGEGSVVISKVWAYIESQRGPGPTPSP